MKKLLFSVFALCLGMLSYGQIVISEISYNPPESGSDSTEYIELYNIGNSSVNLTGYQFTSGVIYTFPNVSIASKGYLVIAVDSVAVMSRFNITGVYQWTNGGLSNGGEPIALKDSSGNMVDSLRYDDGAPWPSGSAAGQPDGGGASIVLCDSSADNTNGANWKASTYTVTGKIINGKQVYGSPGRKDSACTSTPPPPAPIPHYSISTVTSEDSLGVADSLNVKCAVSGIVYGVDMSGTSSSSNSFTVIDGTGGIAVFKSGGFTPSYTVTEGDSVTLWGSISQYNGLTQFSPDSIKRHSQNASLKTATKVTMLGESTESDLIRIDSVQLANPSQWPSAGNNANVDIVTTNGDTLTLRIDRDTDVDDSVTVAPAGYFDVCGLGGQFDFSSPYTSGYQILPRYRADIKASATPPPPPPSIPHYPLGTVTTEDTNGVADSANVKCSVSGVVHGIDMSGLTSSSNTFQLFDATGHITVYKSGGFTPSYTVTESDSVTLWGRVTQYNGLTQFSPDSIKVHKTGSALRMWRLVPMLDETTESDYIKIDSVKLVNPSQWPTIGNNANVDIETLAGDTLTMRIDRDSHVDDSVAAPVGYFYVIGYGGQFDFSSPYTSGYQILPQLKSHIHAYPPATCNQPTSLMTSSVTNVSASLAWTTGGSNTWNIEYGPRGFTPGTGTMVTTSSNPYMLTGLTANTTYDWYVQDSCPSLGVSAWAGPDSFMTLAAPPAIPLYDMNVLRTTNTDGEIDSAGVSCAIEGIVVTDNFSTAGASGPDVSFVIVEEDNSTGFTAISFDADTVIGYSPKLGDSVRVFGTVGQFRGLGQFEIDSVRVHKQGVMIPEAYCTDSLGEHTESRLLQLVGLTIPDTSQWPAVGRDENVDVITMSGDTLVMRIDRHTDVRSVWASAPTTQFNLMAVGGQYDFGKPYFEGYQIFPRFGTDIDSNTWCVDPSGLAASNIGTDSAIISWTGGGKGTDWNLKWGMASGSATDSTIGTGSSYTLKGLTPNTTYKVWLQENCCGGSMSGWISFEFTTLNTSIEAFGKENNLVAYPNPNGIGEVRFNKEVSVTVRNILGQPVKSGDRIQSLNISDLESGVYLIESNEGDTIRLIVQ
jgi:DNA/RNA endonuclease YhcR with UshA esterase domain